MDTRGETTVEIGVALLHHHSHLPRNHIYHVIWSRALSFLSLAIYSVFLILLFTLLYICLIKLRTTILAVLINIYLFSISYFRNYADHQHSRKKLTIRSEAHTQYFILKV